MKFCRIALLLACLLGCYAFAAAQTAVLWDNGTFIKNGVFNVRVMFKAVPDGSTDNSTAISNAFTASNSFTSGIPTIYFDCDTSKTVCVYNYGGSGTSPINPTTATTILCAPGATLNYTGSAHAVDIGPSGLSQVYTDRYTIQGCRFTGGASFTQGIYVNTFIANTLITQNEFVNFGPTGSATAFSIYLQSGNWTPTVSFNYWRDTDGFTRNILDAHAGGNLDLLFSQNKMECETSGGTACSTSTVGIGLWVQKGYIYHNEIKFHQPLIRQSSQSVTTGSPELFIKDNLFEGNTNMNGPAISYGDPNTAGGHMGGMVVKDNFFAYPLATGVPFIGPETASSSSFFLDYHEISGNWFSNTPSSGSSYVKTNNNNVGGYVGGNYGASGALINQSNSSPGFFDGSTPTNSANWAVYLSPGQGVANSVPIFDSNGVNLNKAGFHNITSPLLCLDSSGSGTTQVCATTPEFTVGGSILTPAAGDMIIYKTTTANTGALTINVNTTGAASVKKNQGASNVAAGDVQAGIYIPLTFDGTNWQMQGGSASLVVPTSCSGLPSGALRNNSGTPAICP